jgi:hypothetical protein
MTAMGHGQTNSTQENLVCTASDLLLNWDRDRTDQNKADSARIAEIAARLRSRLRS